MHRDVLVLHADLLARLDLGSERALVRCHLPRLAPGNAPEEDPRLARYERMPEGLERYA